MKPPSRRCADRRLTAVALLPLLPLLLALSAAGCRGTLDVDVNEQVCAPTYEFGNYGCAEVMGRVLGSGGQPLRSVSVGPGYLPDAEAGGYTTPYVMTDAQGRFQLRITRMAQRRVATVPDTFSIYVRAAVIPPPGAATAPRDSVLVRLELAPLGAIPTPAEVEIQLPYP